MENKQTAVEWLIEVLWAPCQGIPSDIIDQAKQMEKEQIIDSFDEGFKYDIHNGGGQQYYNETYKQQDNEN
jgi:hypothetical protein